MLVKCVLQVRNIGLHFRKSVTNEFKVSLELDRPILE